MKSRLVLKTMALAATLFLSGCFVTSQQKPLQQGPVNDETLMGDWRALDDESGKPLNTFLHIQRPDEKAPLRVVFAEDDDYAIYDLTTTQAGTRKVFSLKAIGPAEAQEETDGGFLLGYYEFAGKELRFHLLDAEAVSKLIRAGKLDGVPGAKEYDKARLTGASADITRFLASAEGWNARVKDASRLRRIQPEE